MKKHRILICALGMGILSSAFAQKPGVVSICVKGNGTANDDQPRSLIVTISGDRDMGGLFSLSSGNSTQFKTIMVNSPKHIQITEPGNRAFACSGDLSADTRSIEVGINYPDNANSYCMINSSPNPQKSC